jgi:hypothetical protein
MHEMNVLWLLIQVSKPNFKQCSRNSKFNNNDIGRCENLYDIKILILEYEFIDLTI